MSSGRHPGNGKAELESSTFALKVVGTTVTCGGGGGLGVLSHISYRS